MSRAAAALLLLVLLCSRAIAQPAWLEGFGAPPLGNGLDGDPRALLHMDQEVYCGGSFSQAGDQIAWFVARLEREPDGSRHWVSLTDMNNRIDALVAWGDSVLAGGRFTDVGGVTVNRVAVFDGWSWHPVGDPAAWSWGHVSALAMHDGVPWAAGTGFVVRWTGAAWEAVTGSGFGGDVFALASYDGALAAGGAFSSIVDAAGTPTTAVNIAAWDGVWSALGSGLDGTCYALETWDGTLVAGGVFSSPQPLVAAWNGGSWVAAGPALTGNYVISLERWHSRLIAGGDLSAGGGVGLWNLGYLDATGWHDLGGGTDGQVRAISAELGDVVVGGSFGTCGGLPGEHVGVWVDPTVGVGAESSSPDLDCHAYPNPANASVTIAYELPEPMHVRATFFAVDGSRVATPIDEHQTKGTQRFEWHGFDDRARRVASGTYILLIEAGPYRATSRVEIVR